MIVLYDNGLAQDSVGVECHRFSIENARLHSLLGATSWVQVRIEGRYGLEEFFRLATSVHRANTAEPVTKINDAVW
jgi:hypothetical protein